MVWSWKWRNYHRKRMICYYNWKMKELQAKWREGKRNLQKSPKLSWQLAKSDQVISSSNLFCVNLNNFVEKNFLYSFWFFEQKKDKILNATYCNLLENFSVFEKFDFSTKKRRNRLNSPFSIVIFIEKVTTQREFLFK